jgi:WD40 repeat protein
MLDEATHRNAPSPYLGLQSFTEADRELFHGREAESIELFHLVQRETLTVVFGMSGLGKSSLLRAGLFPRLRAAGLFPIVVRLTYRTRDLLDQVRDTIAAEIAAHGIDAAAPTAGQTLWEYFHRTPFWDPRNRPLIPVVVIDQFEELFTLGERDSSRSKLLAELADLIENRIPQVLRDADDPDALPPSFEHTKMKVVISLREDYLARLEDLKTTIPSIARGRFRLRPMDGTQAVRAIRHPRTESLIEPAVAERVARFVAGADDDAPLEALLLEPALLSLVCRELDEMRLARREPTISKDLLSGESSRILEDFYDRASAGFPPDVRRYLEDHLLTPDGHRTTIAVSTTDRIPGMAAALHALVDRRILRIEQRLSSPHVEIIHDVLAPVMVRRRERRRSEVLRRRRTARRFVVAVSASLGLSIGVGVLLYVGTKRRIFSQALGDASRLVPASGGDGLLAIGDRHVTRLGDDGGLAATRLRDTLYGRAALWEPRTGMLVLAMTRELEIRELATNLVRLAKPLEHGKGWSPNLVRAGTGAGLPPFILVATNTSMSLIARDDGRELADFPERAKDPGELTAAWFESDGRIVTVEETNGLSIWDIPGRKRIHRRPVRSADHGPRDRLVMSWDDQIEIVRYTGSDLHTIKPLACPEHLRFLHATWSSDGRWIAAVASRRQARSEKLSFDICVWNADGDLAGTWETGLRDISRLSFAADGAALLAVGSEPRLWEVPSGKLVKAFSHETLVTAAYVNRVPYIVTIDTANTLRTYDARAEKLVATAQAPLELANGSIDRLAIDPSSGRLITVDHQGALAVTEITTGARLRDALGEMAAPAAVAISPGGASFAVAFGDHVDLWGDGDKPVALEADSIVALAFSPDGRWLAGTEGVQIDDVNWRRTASGLLKIWDVARRRPTLEIATPAALTALAWSPDGRRVVVGGVDGYIKTVDVALETRAPGVVRGIIDRLAPKVDHTRHAPTTSQPTTRFDRTRWLER